MALRVFLAVVCSAMLLFCSASAAGISLRDLITGGSQDPGISVPALPPPTEGNVLTRKVLDTQPYIFKTSDRLLREAEISRDLANKKEEELWIKTTEDLNNLDDTKKHGGHYTVDQTKELYRHGGGGGVGFYSEEAWDLYRDINENRNQANKQYRAALKATDDKDYERQARIFDSAAGMYPDNSEEQKQVENAAMAARARAAAESRFLPLSSWIAISAIIGVLFLIRRKQK
jgi:hypothetical protein